jgi:hypothetical protein
MGFDYAAIGQKLPGVLEEDHAVTQQAPSLLGMEGGDAGSIPVGVSG